MDQLRLAEAEWQNDMLIQLKDEEITQKPRR